MIKEFLLIFLQFAVLAAIGLGIILTFKGLGHGETSETKVIILIVRLIQIFHSGST